MAAPRGALSRGTVLLAAVLGVAGLAGLVASFLVGSAPAPPRPHAGQLIVTMPPTVWGLLFLSPLALGFGAILYRRLTGPVGEYPAGTATMVVSILLAALLFLFLLSLGRGGGYGSISVPTSNPTTPPSNLSGGLNGTSNASNGTTTPVGLSNLTFHLGPWVLVGLVLGICGLVVVLAIPGMVSRIADRPGKFKADGVPDRAQVQAALAQAAVEIDRGEDPRGTVVRLYVRLLAGIAPKVGDVSCLTASEIRRQALSSLGIRPVASSTLTGLFEEARYSTHPIGPAEAQRFREAVRQAEEDLRRGSAS